MFFSNKENDVSYLGDGDSRKQFVQFLIISYGELDMTRINTFLLVIPGCISRELKDLGC